MHHADDKQHGQDQKGSRFSQSDNKKRGQNTADPSASNAGQVGLLIIVPPWRPCGSGPEKELEQPADRDHCRHHCRQFHGRMKVSLIGQMKTGAHKNKYRHQISHHTKDPQLYASEYITHHAAQPEIT